MFNYTSRAIGVFEHELNEYKSVQVTRILNDFYDSDPKRGRRRRRTRCAHRAACETLSNSHRQRGPVMGQRVQGAPEGISAQHAVHCHGTSLAVESNNITLDPDVKDVGTSGASRHAPGPSRFVARGSSRLAAPRSSRRQVR